MRYLSVVMRCLVTRRTFVGWVAILNVGPSGETSPMNWAQGMEFWQLAALITMPSLRYCGVYSTALHVGPHQRLAAVRANHVPELRDMPSLAWANLQAIIGGRNQWVQYGMCCLLNGSVSHSSEHVDLARPDN